MKNESQLGDQGTGVGLKQPLPVEGLGAGAGGSRGGCRVVTAGWVEQQLGDQGSGAGDRVTGKAHALYRLPVIYTWRTAGAAYLQEELEGKLSRLTSRLVELSQKERSWDSTRIALAHQVGQ